MSTVGAGVQYRGGRCSVPWGDTCGGYHEYHRGTQITKDCSPQGTHDIPLHAL